MQAAPKVLSVQSHIVHGYVGNKSAAFPLQLRGWDVDALNTVQFSNHPGYGKFKGYKQKSDEMSEIFSGLVNLKIKYNALILGYLPDENGLKAAFEMARTLCESNPALLWVLDPVLGDNGRMYVPESVIPVYQGMLNSGLVTVATPNQFELEVLTGVKVVDLVSLKFALTKFLDLYKVKHIVVSSVDLGDDNYYSAGAGTEMFYYKVPKLRAMFSGSGDLFSALLCDAVSKNPLDQALNSALSAVDGVLKTTIEKEIARDHNQKQQYDMGGTIRIMNLNLIESKTDLLKNDNLFTKYTFN